MNDAKYFKIIDSILIPVVNYTANKDISYGKEIGEELKKIIYEKYNSIYEDYENTKKIFKQNYMKDPEHKIDRFKVSALFCVVFIDALKKNNFFESKNKKFKYVFVRNVAVNTAMAIIKSFIFIKKDKKNEKYRLYLKKYGFVKPIKNYVNSLVKESIFIEKESSYFLFANIFCAIEDKARDKFANLLKRGKL